MIKRPPGFSGGLGDSSYRFGETWEITVKEQQHESYKDFVVEAVMLSEDRPQGEVVIPGVRLGPEVYMNLAVARKRARQMADVLSGQLDPEWTEKQS